MADFGEIHSLRDIFVLFTDHVWVEQIPVSGKKLRIIHVIGFCMEQHWYLESDSGGYDCSRGLACDSVSYWSTYSCNTLAYESSSFPSCTIPLPHYPRKGEMSVMAKEFTYVSYAVLGIMVVIGIVFPTGMIMAEV